MFALLLMAKETGKVKFEDALTFWQNYRQARVDKVLELNKQIDLRRLPVRPGEEVVAEEEFDLRWLYEPDFKADVEAWIRTAGAIAK